MAFHRCTMGTIWRRDYRINHSNRIAGVIHDLLERALPCIQGVLGHEGMASGGAAGRIRVEVAHEPNIGERVDLDTDSLLFGADTAWLTDGRVTDIAHKSIRKAHLRFASTAAIAPWSAAHRRGKSSAASR